MALRETNSKRIFRLRSGGAISAPLLACRIVPISQQGRFAMADPTRGHSGSPRTSAIAQRLIRVSTRTYPAVMRLYTGTGDDGTTGLFGGERVAKDHPRVVAYGEADALNAFLGFAAAGCTEATITKALEALQPLVFQLGADLATPLGAKHEDKVTRLSEKDVTDLEACIDEFDGATPNQQSFVMPGGCELAARLHLARNAARRCERAMVTLAQSDARSVSEAALRWINRCSDLLFAMARSANWRAGVPDVPWKGP